MVAMRRCGGCRGIKLRLNRSLRFLARLRYKARDLVTFGLRYCHASHEFGIHLYETKVPPDMKERLAKAVEDWKKGKLPAVLQRPNDEAEFLPAALEIVERPPSPASRAIAGTIILFFTIALLWACFGTVDIIAIAQGKIVPTGRTQVIQPLESGVVHSIHVQDGQAVKAGDVLIEIDSTITEAERDRISERIY